MAPSFSRAEAEPLCNFGRRRDEEQFFEIILNLDQWFRSRCYFKKKFIEGMMDQRHMPVI